jgi:hypothetical protein
MTAQQYADSRPDLANNWEQAWSDNNGDGQDDSDTAQWIRSFGSFDAYIENDHGGPFDQPVSIGPMPSISVTSSAAQSYLNARPDLANNWAAAWNPANAYDGTSQWIRGFGSFQAYLENDHGGPFTISPPPVVTLPPPIIPPIVSPPYVPPVSGGSPGSGVNLPPGGVSPFFDPTHRLIGQTAAGPLYMLVDEGGSIITWIEGRTGITNYGNAGRATKSAALTAAELSQSMAAAVGGPRPPGAIVPPVAPGAPGAVNLPPGGISTDYDPTHRLVGYTREGYEVYRLTDEGGHLVEWYDIPGQGAQSPHYLSGANDPTSYVFATSRPGVPPTVSPSAPAAAKSNLGTFALIAGAAAVAYFATRDN